MNLMGNVDALGGLKKLSRAFGKFWYDNLIMVIKGR